MIVSNTTPLSNFLQLERMEILRQLFDVVHVPFAVTKEIEEYFHGNKQWQECVEEGFIRVHHVQPSFMVSSPLHILHQGEAEALLLCLEKKAELCLLDDKDARAVASLHHIPVTGTLGLLIAAKKKGLLSVVRPLMDILRDKHSFWISGKMYQHVLYIAGEL